LLFAIASNCNLDSLAPASYLARRQKREASVKGLQRLDPANFAIRTSIRERLFLYEYETLRLHSMMRRESFNFRPPPFAGKLALQGRRFVPGI
jgi:hypothetical protein